MPHLHSERLARVQARQSGSLLQPQEQACLQQEDELRGSTDEGPISWQCAAFTGTLLLLHLLVADLVLLLLPCLGCSVSALMLCIRYAPDAHLMQLVESKP